MVMTDTELECGLTCTCRDVPPPDPPLPDTNIPVFRPPPDPSGPMLQRLKGLQQSMLNKPGGLHGKSYAINPAALSDPENLDVVIYIDGVKDYAGKLAGWTPKPLKRGVHIQWFGGGIYWDPND